MSIRHFRLLGLGAVVALVVSAVGYSNPGTGFLEEAYGAAHVDTDPIVVGDFTWQVDYSPFGVDEVATARYSDGMDSTSFLVDNSPLECDSSGMDLSDPGVAGIISRVTCNADYASVAGASADLGFEAFIDFFEAGGTPLSVDGDLARTVVTVTNNGLDNETFDFEFDYDFGEYYSLDLGDEADGYSVSVNVANGADSGTLPVAAAIGNIPGASLEDITDDYFEVRVGGYVLAPGEELTVAYFHRVLDPDAENDIDIIPAKLYYDALPEFSSFSDRLSLGLDDVESVLGWSDMPSASQAVGDVSGAMRYDSDGPYGAPIGFTDPGDVWEFDDNAQWFELDASFPINFFGAKIDSLCVATNGGIYPSPGGETAFDQCDFDEYDKSLEEIAKAAETQVIAPLGADINLEMCPAEEDGGDRSRYFDGFGYPCSVYIDPYAQIDGQDAVVVTWYRVQMYSDDNDESLFNTFQVVLFRGDGGDVTDGYDIRVEFNYGTVQDPEDGYNPDVPAESCGDGDECRWAVGWSDYNPDTSSATAFELFPNTSPSDLVDGNPTALTANYLNSGVPGRYTFQMVDGETLGFAVPNLGPQPSSSNQSPEGPHGIFLTILGSPGDRISGVEVLFGSYSIAPNAPYLLSWQGPSGLSVPRVLRQGRVNSGGHLEEQVSLAGISDGSYRIVLSSTSESGLPLRLTNVIAVDSAEVLTYKTPESLQPYTR